MGTAPTVVLYRRTGVGEKWTKVYCVTFVRYSTQEEVLKLVVWRTALTIRRHGGNWLPPSTPQRWLLQGIAMRASWIAPVVTLLIFCIGSLVSTLQTFFLRSV